VRDEAEFGPNLIRHWIDSAAAHDPDKAYIVSVDDRSSISYRQLQRLTRQIATFLAEREIQANDRVALLAGNSIEHLVCYLGVMAYGATICTIHVEMNRRYLTQIVPMLDPRLAVFDTELELDEILSGTSVPSLPLGSFNDSGSGGFFELVAGSKPSDASAANTRPQDSACVLFTSGTSAWPKGVVLTFRELMANVEPTADGLGMTADDRIYDFRSFNWCSAQVLSALAPLSRGATLILGRKFTRSRFFRNVVEHGATMTAGNPTTINMLLNGNDAADATALASLKFIISSSAPLLSEDWRRFEERFGVPIAVPIAASIQSASRRLTSSSRSSIAKDGRCRSAKSVMSRSAASLTTTFVTWPTTEPSRRTAADVCEREIPAFSMQTAISISPAVRRT
jgi:acyl-coenzyme A synthetase/AMP-(fatty) acid ligase